MSATSKTDRQEETLEAVRDVNRPFVVTDDLAERLDMTTEGARGRLNMLADDGLLRRKQVGAAAVVWWEA